MKIKLKQTPIEIDLGTLSFEIGHELNISNKELKKFVLELLDFNDMVSFQVLNALRVLRECQDIVDRLTEAAPCEDEPARGRRRGAERWEQ